MGIDQAMLARKHHNYAIATKVQDYDDFGGFFSIYDFAVGKMATVDDWKKDKGIDTQNIGALNAGLKSRGNLITFAVDNIDPKEAQVMRNFPKFSPHTYYNEVGVRVYWQDPTIPDPGAPREEPIHIDGHSNGLSNRAGRNHFLYLVSFYHVTVRETKLLPIPPGVMWGDRGYKGMFVSAICSVQIAKVRRGQEVEIGSL